MLGAISNWYYGQEEELEEHEVVASAMMAASAVAVAVARDGEEVERDMQVFDEMELDGEQQALVAELHEAHAEIMQGGNTALILTKLDELLQRAEKAETRAEKAESRLDVLEANGFIVALKWIWEKLCELGNKMQKAMIDIGENFPGFGGKAKRAAEFQDLDKLYEKELSRIDKLAGKNELGGEVNEKEYNAFLLVGIFTMLFLSALNEKYIRRIIFTGFIATIVLLILVFFFGEATKGAKRWLNIVGFSLQPSEFLKPFYTCFIAIILSHTKSKINFRIFCICIAFNLLIAVLLLLQPDFGMTITHTIATFAMFFVAGIKLSWLLLVLVFFFCGIYGAYLFFPHVAIRIDKFMDPTNSSNYQVQKSVSSYLNGGFFGKGPGEGTIKYVLPDAHTDFIFAVGAEEFGLIFCIIIVVAFAIFILRAFWNLTKSSNLFHIYAIFGIMMHFAMQFLFNIGVTLNIFPTKGMTLPFISYGGSSMLAFSIAAGIYLNLSKDSRADNLSQNKKFFYVKDI